MAGKDQKVKFKRTIQATPQEVYEAFTHAAALCEWLCNVAQADARPGGRLYLWWNNGYYASGEYTELKPGERVCFSWHGRNEPGISQVEVSLKALEEGGTRLSLVHEQPAGGKAWRQARREYQRGWKRGLENLQSVLETGMDLRFVSRPILGLSGGEDVDAVKAIELGLPARAGILVTGLVEGLGAAAAGLQKGDLLVKLGGKKINGYTSLLSALQGHRAGDEVKAVVYRQSEKLRLPVVLSPRPVPELPDTLEGCVDALEKNYHQVILELESCLEGAGDELAAYRPAEGEWNAKENLAHLIANERDLQGWITGLIEGQDPAEIYHTNLSTRLSATVSAFRSMPALLEELKRSQAETLAMFAGLPDELVARKGTFWRLRYTALDQYDHVREHVEAICALVQAAREQGATPAAAESAIQSGMDEPDDEALHAREQAAEEPPKS